MGAVIGDMLFLGLGIAIGPMPVVVIILLLSGRRGRARGVAYLGGWIVGLVLLEMGVYLFVRGKDFSRGSTELLILSWAMVVAGIALLAVAYITWRRRPPAGQKTELPHWVQALHQVTPLLALGAGFGFGLISVKNLVFASAAAASVGRAQVDFALAVFAIALFTLVATSGIAAPVYVAFAKGAEAQRILDGWVEWLATHNALILTLLCLFFGIRLLGDGIGGLF